MGTRALNAEQSSPMYGILEFHPNTLNPKTLESCHNISNYVITDQSLFQNLTCSFVYNMDFLVL